MRSTWSGLPAQWKQIGNTNQTIAKEIAGADLDLSKYARDKFPKEYLQSAQFAKQGDEMYQKRFDKRVKALAQELSKDKVLAANAKAKEFLQKLINDMTEEYRYWSAGPIQKQYATEAAKRGA